MLDEYDIVVIGGGFAGVFAAIEAASQKKGNGKPLYKNILLIEANDDILGASSRSECYKLHTGLHYAGDAATAKECLIESLDFAKKYIKYILGNNNDGQRPAIAHPWQ
ncbi:MAG: FAD-dependent oxidoreductase, partial [Gammaproteobacteria bacterium]